MDDRNPRHPYLVVEQWKVVTKASKYPTGNVSDWSMCWSWNFFWVRKYEFHSIQSPWWVPGTDELTPIPSLEPSHDTINHNCILSSNQELSNLTLWHCRFYHSSGHGLYKTLSIHKILTWFCKRVWIVTLSRFTIRNKAWWDKKVIGCLSFCIFVCVTVIAKICKHWGHIAAQSARACKAKILPGHSNRITTTENSLWK